MSDEFVINEGIKQSLNENLLSTSEVAILQQKPKRVIHNMRETGKMDPIYTSPAGTNFYWNTSRQPLTADQLMDLKQYLRENLLSTAEVAAKYQITCNRIKQLKASGLISPIFTRPKTITDLYWKSDVTRQIDLYQSQSSRRKNR